MWLVFLFIALAVGLGIWGYRFSKDMVNDFKEEFKLIGEDYGESLSSVQEIMPYFLGTGGQKRKILVLLQNNTELRPTGGFIGTYGIIEIKDGELLDWFIQGTEILDGAANPDSLQKSPEPLEKYMVQPVYYFRDGNWSPDFPTAVNNLLVQYNQETGTDTKFDGVVAINATVLERMMEYIGNIEVEGVELRADNFIERLEYEVEYGYEQRGHSFENRKNFIPKVFEEILKKFEEDPMGLWPMLVRVPLESLMDNHILLWSADTEVQENILKQGGSGQVHKLHEKQDGFMVVDANLASLKTDHAIERSYDYKVSKDELLDRWNGELTVTYKHNGTFDWRTTRYRSYTRFYLPKGANLADGEGAMVKDRSDEQGAFQDWGEEFGRKVYGAFISVEPGQTHVLRIKYQLPENIDKAIESGLYTLFVQKQPGLHNPELTIALDFGKNITAAAPGEDESQWGDTSYKIKTDLRVSRNVWVEFQKTK